MKWLKYHHLPYFWTVAREGSIARACDHLDLAKRLRRRFPNSLEDAPILLPVRTTTWDRSLDLWFESNDIRPAIKGEFDDSSHRSSSFPD